MFASSFEVIDPCNRTGKITVPLRLIEETRGVMEFQHAPQNRDIKDLSLCLLFQQGRCKAGLRCHQVHADPSYVASLRQQAACGSTCCAAHGDMHSLNFKQSSQHVKVAAPGEEPAFYPLTAFGRTAAMDAFIRNANGGYVQVSVNKVCRLHSQGRCKFGKDCKNIHLCPRATALDAPPMTSFACGNPLSTGIAPVCSSLSVCGISIESNSNPPSSIRDSPNESALSLDCSALAESTFKGSINEPSPLFDADELELSRLCNTLCESVLSMTE